MKLSDTLNEELDVFISKNEFAEDIIIDSKIIQGIFTSKISEENKLKLGSQGGYGYGEALYLNEKEIIIKTKESPHKYKKGDGIEVNNCLYEVLLVEEAQGLITLIIGEQGN